MTPTAPLTLADLPRHARGRVQRVVAEGSLGERLRELGFTPGTEVRLLRRAPLGDPLVIELRQFQLCLRRNEARLIEIEAEAGA